MDDVLAMEILDRSTGLDHIATDLRLREVLSCLDHFHQRTVLAQLQHDVGALAKGKGSVELDNVRVVHFGVDLQLRFELERVTLEDRYRT